MSVRPDDEKTLLELRSTVLPPDRTPCKYCHRISSMKRRFTCRECRVGKDNDQKCGVPDCSHRRYFGSDYCSEHSDLRCVVISCNRPVIDQATRLCRRHLYPCSFTSCKRQALVYSMHCVRHGGKTWDAVETKIHDKSESEIEVFSEITTDSDPGFGSGIISESDSSSLPCSPDPRTNGRIKCRIKGCKNLSTRKSKCHKHRYCFTMRGVVYENLELKFRKQRAKKHVPERVGFCPSRNRIEIFGETRLLCNVEGCMNKQVSGGCCRKHRGVLERNNGELRRTEPKSKKRKTTPVSGSSSLIRKPLRQQQLPWKKSLNNHVFSVSDCRDTVDEDYSRLLIQLPIT